MSKPREFWIAQTETADLIMKSEESLWKIMGDWDQENTERIHVIEKSAFDDQATTIQALSKNNLELGAEIEMLKKRIEALRAALKYCAINSAIMDDITYCIHAEKALKVDDEAANE